MDKQRWMYEWHQGRPYLCPRRGRVIDPVSNTRLAECHPDVIAKVNLVEAVLAKQGICFRVVAALRTYAEQDREYAKGPAFTRARGGYSAHNFGMAVDCAPFVAGHAGAIEWHAQAPNFQAMVAAMKSAGMKWGGDWVHMPGDFDHFYIGPATPTDADREAFAAGGLAAVWARLDNSTRGQTGNG